MSAAPGPGEPKGTPPGMPRWVKVLVMVLGLLALLLVAAMLLTGGEHGPGRHMSHVVVHLG